MALRPRYDLKALPSSPMPPEWFMTRDLKRLQTNVRDFAQARDWEQFHTPKNLAMALAGEAGELLAIFQWLTPEESAALVEDAPMAEAMRDELADVLYYLLRIADVTNVDLDSALATKLQKNNARYPVSSSRGSAKKYTELKSEG